MLFYSSHFFEVYAEYPRFAAALAAVKTARLLTLMSAAAKKPKLNFMVLC